MASVAVKRTFLSTKAKAFSIASLVEQGEISFKIEYPWWGEALSNIAYTYPIIPHIQYRYQDVTTEILMEWWASLEENYFLFVVISVEKEPESRQADDKRISEESAHCPSTSKKRKLLDYDQAADNVEKVKPQAILEGRELWECFYRLGTEMIITKSGRYVIKYLYELSEGDLESMCVQSNGFVLRGLLWPMFKVRSSTSHY